jgi:hypothetical protein
MANESLTDLISLICVKSVGILLASVGANMLFSFPSYYKSEAEFEANKVSVTGVVVETSEEKSLSGGGLAPLNVTRTRYSKVKFQTIQSEWVEFTTSDACFSEQDCEHKTVLVQYDPNLPSQARIQSDVTLHNRARGYIVFSLCLFLVGTGLLVLMGIELLVICLNNRQTRLND